MISKARMVGETTAVPNPLPGGWQTNDTRIFRFHSDL